MLEYGKRIYQRLRPFLEKLGEAPGESHKPVQDNSMAILNVS